MKLDHEFIQLPIFFDAEQLANEVDAIPSERWHQHHEGFKGNYSIPLVSVGGTDNNAFKGPMATTDVLENAPYLKTVLASFGEVIGRSRLMGLAPDEEVPVHSDINYHWFKRVRIHVPITTTEDVTFYCGEKQVHMKAGEAWVFDSWKYHRVVNKSNVFRVHLVIDICGSSRFWDLVRRGNIPGMPVVTPDNAFEFVTKPRPCSIKVEQFNVPLVMSPGEMDGLANELFNELNSAKGNDETEKQTFIRIVSDFCQDWRVLWSQYGTQEAGWKHYHAIRDAAFNQVKQYDQSLVLENGTQAPRMFLFCMIDAALNTEVKDSFYQGVQLPAGIGEPEKPSALPKRILTERDDGLTPNAEDNKTIVPPSRNAPCPCGSGIRYKNCHGKLG